MIYEQQFEKMELNPRIVSDENVSKLGEEYFCGSVDVKDEDFEVYFSPFKVLKIDNLCSNKSFLQKLTDEVKGLEFNRKNNDLYSLYQTEDLTHSNNLIISDFVKCLRRDVGKMLSTIMNVKFNDNFTLTASLYKSGDVLLCHDDKCTDRCVAFIYYLTGTGKEGEGAFQMFDKLGDGQPSGVVKSVPPMKNSFLCFEVGNFTYHQVSEVLDSSFERYSLNGWFHSDREIEPLDYVNPMPRLMFQCESLGEVFFDEFINVIFAVPSALVEAQKKFEFESQILLQDFIRTELFSNCTRELKEAANWSTSGPANRRNYNTIADIQQPNLKKLVNFLGSPAFFSFLSSVTGLDLVPKVDGDAHSSVYTIEVQKWDHGSYTMATDNDELFQKPGLDLYLWLNLSSEMNLDWGGSVVYLATDDDPDEDDDKELLTIDPVENGLALVYRTEDTVRFTKYLNRSLKEAYYCIAATYFEVDET